MSLRFLTPLAVAAVLMTSSPVMAELPAMTSATTTYHTVAVDGLQIFYREAGPRA
jgi:hypothetical protein